MMSAIKRIHAATDFSELGNEEVRRAAIIAAREDAELLVTTRSPGRVRLTPSLPPNTTFRIGCVP